MSQKNASRLAETGLNTHRFFDRQAFKSEQPGGDSSVMLARLLVFGYGIFCYGVFFATFIYAIGFIGNLFVTRSLDSAARRPAAAALAIDLALLGLFALQHSVMARSWFKRAWTKFVPNAAERSTYVLFSSLALILMFWFWEPIGGAVWSIENAALRSAVYVVYALGWIGLLLCTFVIDHFDLFGLRQVYYYLIGREMPPLQFAVRGPYKAIRHPIYLAWLTIFWATPTMTIAHLVFALATTAYILIAIRFEERDLVREHGSLYENYRRTVPMIVPMPRRSTTEVRPIPGNSRQKA